MALYRDPHEKPLDYTGWQVGPRQYMPDGRFRAYVRVRWTSGGLCGETGVREMEAVYDPTGWLMLDEVTPLPWEVLAWKAVPPSDLPFWRDPRHPDYIPR